MSEPKEITEVINALERAAKSPRELARERVAQFRLDREKGERPLPVVNLTTGSGAPLLDRDAVLGHRHHDARLGKR